MSNGAISDYRGRPDQLARDLAGEGGPTAQRMAEHWVARIELAYPSNGGIGTGGTGMAGLVWLGLAFILARILR